MPFLRSDRPGGHRPRAIGIKNLKRLKKHHKMNVSSISLVLHMNGNDD
ncbi:hypothetical protein G3P86_004514 [Escherichia coli]|nr:hypothetical protein [Escherichia coli]EFJ0006719.1 hypothetical protein [Escherichia coli]EFJ0517916.1 hypothetical protein [Escherichia coli]EFJ3930581.1 hypothetical protein [Escherichia coli]